MTNDELRMGIGDLISGGGLAVVVMEVIEIEGVVEILGVTRGKIGSARKVFGGSRRIFPSPRRDFVPNRKKIGSNRTVFGFSRMVLGGARKVLGISRRSCRGALEVFGTSRGEPGASRKELGTGPAWGGNGKSKEKSVRCEPSAIHWQAGKPASLKLRRPRDARAPFFWGGLRALLDGWCSRRWYFAERADSDRNGGFGKKKVRGGGNLLDGG
jgi:hypothetical protein